MIEIAEKLVVKNVSFLHIVCDCANVGASRDGIEDSFLVSCLNNFQNVFASTKWICSKNNNFAFLTGNNSVSGKLI